MAADKIKVAAVTPEGLFHMPISGSSELVTRAALGDNNRGAYAIHLVNNGASREAILSGLPESVDKLRIFTTNSCKDMEEEVPVPVENGRTFLMLDAVSYVTLMTQ